MTAGMHDKEQEAAFKEVKELLHSAKLLVHYDPDKEITHVTPLLIGLGQYSHL